MLPFVDTHLHFFDLSRFRYPWLDGADSTFLGGADHYLPDDWHRDAEGLDVVGCVHVQAELDHQIDPVEETAWLAELKPATAIVYVGYADLRRPDLDEVLARHCEHQAMRGIRQPAWFDPDSARADLPRSNLLSDAGWRRGLSRLAKNNLSFDLFVYWHQLEQAAGVFADIPELTVIVEHLGLPPIDDPASMHVWRRGMADVAHRVPNARLKVSGIGEFAPGGAQTTIETVLREGIELFGPQRCMLGSNYPVDRPSATYRRLWQLFYRVTTGLSEAERSAVFSETALQTYRITH